VRETINHLFILLLKVAWAPKSVNASLVCTATKGSSKSRRKVAADLCDGSCRTHSGQSLMKYVLAVF